MSYSLKETLKQAGVQCYLLRAAPDGEGDWSQEGETTLVQIIRRKGLFTETWIERMCQDIARRPLPFLVDVGGKPQPWQEGIFAECTHAILLTKDADTHAFWRALVTKYNLTLIADLHSEWEGEAQLAQETPHIIGTITHLRRHRPAQGVVFDTLIQRLKQLLPDDYETVLADHQIMRPVETVIDIPTLHRAIKPTHSEVWWQPQDLLAVLNQLPQIALGFYGNGPIWLYATVACHIFPEPFYLFDARLGWLKTITLNQGQGSPFVVTFKHGDAFIFINISINQGYLTYTPNMVADLPEPLEANGVILGGKLPNWLFTSLALYYQTAAWVAIYYPHTNEAVIVVSQFKRGPWAIGQTIDLTGSEALIVTV
ncbi:MAG: CRISPR-associated protein Csx3 [Chloroflexota bacterium]